MDTENRSYAWGARPPQPKTDAPYDPNQHQYPAHRHGPNGEAHIVHSAEEDAQLMATGRWAKSPAHWTDRLLRSTAPVEETLTYPVTLFAADGRWQVVKTEADHVALGPGWHTSIAEAVAAKTGTAEESAPEAEEAKILNELHSATVDTLRQVIGRVSNISDLQRLLAREALNPKHEGGRATVVTAIDVRIDELRRQQREAAEEEALAPTR